MPRPPRPFIFLLLALLIPLLLASSLVWLGAENARGDQLRADVGASYARQMALIGIQSEMRAAETSQRGYVITGDKEFRLQYDRSHARVISDFSHVTALYRGMPSQLGKVAALNRTATGKFREMSDVLNRYDRVTPEAARRRITDGEGKRLMGAFQNDLDSIIRAEQKVGALEVAGFTNRTLGMRRVLWIAVAVISLGLALLLYGQWRQRQTQYTAELRGYESAKRNETILNSTVDPIIIVNPSGSIETINSAATQMLGYEPGTLARRDFDVLSDIALGAGSFHERIGLSDGILRVRYWPDRHVRHRDGRRLPVDIALGVMPLPDGDHIVVSLRDINERKRTDRLKDELISTVSHELRTPLTSIVGALGLLRMEGVEKMDEEAAGLIAIAENNAQRLIRLINDMLDVDRIDSGKLRMTPQPIDLRHVLLRACEDNSSLARTFDMTLDCMVPDESLMIQGDEERLIQVVTNLLSNALKVSPTGGHVALGIDRSSDGRRAIIHVDDDGPGIPTEFRARIFGRFERAANSNAFAGTGLGLAIAREIVRQHGGELWFEDRTGGGTRFAFSLPVTLPAVLSRDIGGEAKILVCESDPAVARALQAQLAQEGYMCRIVATSKAAREAIVANGYSLLLLDMALDDEDAFQFAREVRQMEGPDDLSILMVSSDGCDQSSPVSLDLVDWIEKPIDPFRLRAALGTAFRHSGIERPTVLHLDDDQDTLEITASALKGVAYILKAATLAEARDLLRVETPHLAILDVHLEHGLGLDLLPDLVDAKGVAIPTIIYSAHDVDVEISGQIDAVLVKSRTSLPDLKATVRRVVATRHFREADE